MWAQDRILDVLCTSAEAGDATSAMILIGYMAQFVEAGMEFPERLKRYTVNCYTRVQNGEKADAAFNLRGRRGRQKDFWETETRKHMIYCDVEKQLEEGTSKSLEDAYHEVGKEYGVEWNHVRNLYYEERHRLEAILPELYGPDSPNTAGA